MSMTPTVSLPGATVWIPECLGVHDAVLASEDPRSEEHTSELQSQSISYAVFCLKKKKNNTCERGSTQVRTRLTAKSYTPSYSLKQNTITTLHYEWCTSIVMLHCHRWAWHEVMLWLDD